MPHIVQYDPNEAERLHQICLILICARERKYGKARPCPDSSVEGILSQNQNNAEESVSDGQTNLYLHRTHG